VKHHYRSYHEYFRLLSGFADLGHAERAWLISEGTIGHLVDFYTDTVPLQGFNQRASWSDHGEPTRANPPNVMHMGALSAALVSSCFGPHDANLGPRCSLPDSELASLLRGLEPQDSQKLTPVQPTSAVTPSSEPQTLQFRGFLPMLLQDREAYEHAVSMALHLAHNNPGLSRSLIELASHECWEQVKEAQSNS